MIEQLVSIGGSIASIYSAISAVGTGSFQQRVIPLLLQQNQTLIRISDGILYAPHSHSLRVQFEEKVIAEIGRIRELLTPLHQSLKADILSSAALQTPEKLRRELGNDPWSCLDGIRPARLIKYDRSSDWVPMAFEFDNQVYVGWQKRGILNAVLGVDFRSTEQAWLDSATSRTSTPQSSPIQSELPNNLAQIVMSTGSVKKPAVGVRGVVKWYNATKGYGFLRTDNDLQDVFVGVSALQRAGLVNLTDNQRISFDIVEYRGRLSAERLVLLE